MFGMKSKAEKQEEIKRFDEWKLKQEASKKKAEKKLEEVNAKIKRGTTFKYLGLKAMVRRFYIDTDSWLGSEYYVAVDAVYVNNGEIMPLAIDIDLLEALMNCNN